MSNLPTSINLLMPPSEKEVNKSVRRNKVDLTSVIVIFVFVIFGVVILVLDMVLKGKKTKLEDEQQVVINQINNKSEVERVQRLMNDKWISFKSVKNYTVTDYSEKILILSKYLDENCEVEGYTFANDYTYTFNGKCRNLDNLTAIVGGLEGEPLMAYAGIQSFSLADPSDSGLDDNVEEGEFLSFRIFGAFNLNEVE